MSTPRIVAPNVPLHVTVKAAGGMKLFVDDVDRHEYLRCLHQYAGLCQVAFDAWVLMMTHAHMVAVAPDAGALSMCMGRANRDYALFSNKRRGRTGHQLFERPFWSCPLDEPHYICTMGYVERNPLAAGIVEHVQDYPFSSALYHRGLASVDPIVDTPSRFGIEFDWEYLHSSHARRLAPYEKAIEEATRRGVPIGTQGFHMRMAEATGLSPKKWVSSAIAACDLGRQRLAAD